MKKKQLNRQQLFRIQKIQNEHAARAGRRQTRSEEAIGHTELGPEQAGIVIAHFGQQLDIEAREGDNKGRIFRCHQRTNLEPLVAGDRVIWQAGDPVGVVVANLPRRTLLTRPSSFGDLRPVAANIDTLIIVIAPLPQAYPNLIDRYLVAAEQIPVQPVIVLNKADLLTHDSRDELHKLLGLYQKIAYPVLQVSSKTLVGMPDLKALLNDRTSIVVGQSGVGKSALINALLPGVNTLEGELSEGHEKGRHTTSSARLFHFPDGGDLIDSPGIREFGLWHLEPADVYAGFIEFRPYLGHCKFRDCRHELEPGCRLLQAVADGDIDPGRMASYRQILQSIQSDTSPAFPEND
ncbi:MAG: small ribosomal subunit biogenesis GTPase RsgA [Pseudomonadales bacterium]|nr:small ribosomal subunit biogenesis GTPase RsgA [Pseudomonadales bacterium]